MDIRYIITMVWFLLLFISIAHLQLLYNQIAKLKPEILMLDESKYEVIKQAIKFNNEFALSVSDMNRTIYNVLFWSRKALLGGLIIYVGIHLNL